MKMLKMAAILLAAAAPMAFGWTAGADESTNEVDDAVMSVPEESTPEAVEDTSEIGEAGEALLASHGCPYFPFLCRRYCRAARISPFGKCLGPGSRTCVCVPPHPYGGPAR